MKNNKNKLNSIETRRTVIAHLLPFVLQVNSPHPQGDDSFFKPR